MSLSIKQKHQTQINKLQMESTDDFLDLRDSFLTEVPNELFSLTHLTQLDLTRNSISELPEDFSRLSNLEFLGLGLNQFKHFPKVVFKLKKLKTLQLQCNYIEQIPEEISELQELEAIWLNNNLISKIPKSIGELKNLIRLSIWENRIEEIPKAIFELRKLRFLHLSNNRILKIPSYISKLKELDELSIDNNYLEKFPNQIFGLKKLRSISIGGNNFNKIPDDINRLTNLKSLDCSNTENLIIPKSIWKMSDLTALQLSNCNLKRLSADIHNLIKLDYLDISNNELIELPKEFADIRENLLLVAQGNKFIKPPIEIVEKRSAISLKQYFNDVENEGEDYLNEIKILMVGEGRVGKTTLTKLLSNTQHVFNEERTTEGIEVYKFEFTNQEKTKSFFINIWDFGGQSIYHSTHQFFLTKRSIYLLVTESRREDQHEDFHYWLNIINLLGGESPIIICLNKCDEPNKEIPFKEYKKIFNNIITLEKVSCLSTYSHTIEVLKNTIWEILNNKNYVPHFGTPLPKTWIYIRMVIDNLKNNNRKFIPLNEYFEICQSYNKNEEQALVLSEYFNDIGVFIHFQNDRILKDTIFLDHQWMTKGVYKLLDSSKAINNKGYFSYSLLSTIWDDEQFISKKLELITVMQKFDLCFEIRNNYFLIPQLLPMDAPNEIWVNSNKDLLFQYHYKFMPKGILSRIIVKLNHYIIDEKYWRYGVVIQYEETYALIQEIFLESPKKILIRIHGKNNYSILELIRNVISEIHKDFKGIEYYEMLPCPCSYCSLSDTSQLYSYKTLKHRISNGNTTLNCHMSDEEIDIAKLIYGIEVSNSGKTDKILLSIQELKEKQNELLGLQKETIDKFELNFKKLLSQSENIEKLIDEESKNIINITSKRIKNLERVKISKYEVEKINIVLSTISEAIELISKKVPTSAALKTNEFSKEVSVSPELNSTGKLKLMLPIIPYVLSYESELSFSMKAKLSEIWEDFKNGDFFFKKKTATNKT